MKALVKSCAPTLIDQYGVGNYVAATLLVTAGDNPERLKKASSFAALCGASALESGKTQRHRLNRGGAGDAGKSNKEIQRCLKRYIARELCPIIVSDLSCLT